MSQEQVISVENVGLTIGKNAILRDINMEMCKGKIYGFVGRNGSGKTMLMKCICGFVRVTEGKITVNGKQVGEDVDFPDNIGIIIENPEFVPYYNGYKNLKLLADVKKNIGKEEIRDAMIMAGLDPDLKLHVGRYSLGMRQRLGISQAIMEDPDILILDEPMNGLDNEGVEDVRKILLKLKQKGKTIIIASHNKEDINILCDKVWNLEHGRIVE
mgnify:CR=1 FL=1